MSQLQEIFSSKCELITYRPTLRILTSSIFFPLSLRNFIFLQYSFITYLFNTLSYLHHLILHTCLAKLLPSVHTPVDIQWNVVVLIFQVNLFKYGNFSSHMLVVYTYTNTWCYTLLLPCYFCCCNFLECMIINS